MKRIILAILAFLISLTNSFASERLNMQSYVDYGEQYMGKPWPALPLTEFARYRKEGNRVGYENLVFERRRHLAALAMAEITERKGRFVADIVDGLEVMMEEPWWGIPAHYNKDVPQYDIQTFDILLVESAALIAWTGHELKAELDSFSPEIYRKISREIKHRILDRALGSRDWWKKAGMNWNPWICSNWLACVMLYETDAERRQKAVEEIQGCMRVFIDSYPEDGGCDEGASYWDRAAGALSDCLYLMKQMRDDSLATNITIMDYRKDKVARMAAYIYNMYIADNYVVSFADAHSNRGVAQLNVVWPFAYYLDDKQMKGYAAWIAEKEGFWENPARLYASEGNFPSLGRELRLLGSYEDLQQTTPCEPQNECWMENLQIATMRRKGLYVAVKGGNNGESHNHNDVGSYVVYNNGLPILIDCGVGEYTSKTFSKERYGIWTMQSAYHNLPQINGVDQKDGKEFAAKIVKKTRQSLTLDISGAYPSEAAVKQWRRTVAMNGQSVVVTEDYELGEWKSESCLMFMTNFKPKVENAGSVTVGTCKISFPKRLLEVSVDDLSEYVDPILRSMWGNNIYRIVLKIKGRSLRNKLTCRISALTE